MSLAEGGSLKTIETSGTYDEMGAKLGAACKQEAELMISDAKAAFSRKSRDWDMALRSIRKYVPFVEEFNADQLSFIRSYSKGSGLSFEDVFMLFCLDEKGLCTDVMTNGRRN